MTGENRIDEYLEILSSKAPVPGGGGASALAGALGTALGQMVISLTLGKKKYADAEEEFFTLQKELEGLRQRLLHLADEDARVFEPLAKAYSLPCATQEEKEIKDLAMEENLLAASLVPLQIMEICLEVLPKMEILEKKGSRMAVSDVGVSVQLLRSSLLGAVMNVWINTKSMKNREKAEELNERAKDMTKRGTRLADDIYGRVLGALL